MSTKEEMWRYASKEMDEAQSYGASVRQNHALEFLADKLDALRAEMKGGDAHAPDELRAHVNPPPVGKAGGADNPACDFCGQHRRDVKKILRGMCSHICNECVGLCVQILAEEGP